MHHAPWMPARRSDRDGRLIIDRARISKASVSSYIARDEIPGWRDLGLNEDGEYLLLRDPVELEKAARSFCGLPILSRHAPMAMDGYPEDLVVGVCGNDAFFDGTYLRCSLMLFDWPTIRDIGTGTRSELSCAYAYNHPIMKPGRFRGQAFDGRMVKLVGKHLAIVDSGKVGPDCAL